MAAGVSVADVMPRLLALIVLLSVTLHGVKGAAFVTLPSSTTTDTLSDYTCPIECMCYRTNETTNVPPVWINCTVDYFSPHVTELIKMISSPLVAYAFFVCSYSNSKVLPVLPPESMLWDGVFVAMGQLKALVFEHCRFKRITMNGFRGLVSLTQLVIRDAAITDLDPGLLTYLPQLDILEMTYCSLTHLFPVCTSGSLRVLNISGNHFLSLENAGLHCYDNSVSRLETLDVNNNFISEIPEWIGQSLPNLYQLGIADNYISKFVESPFENLHKLTFLDFSNNSITSFSSKFFKGNSNLLVLGMSWNKVSAFPRSLLANLSVLIQLDMGSMDVDDNVWMELTELRQLGHLNLTSNKLTSINVDVMSQFLRLQYCYLSHNQISSLPKASLEYQVNLSTLDLSFNEISDIPSGAFKNQNVLKHLYLHHNNIMTIGYETFSQLKDLLILDISHNKISSLPAKTIFGLNKLTYLDLSNNRLTQMDNDFFSKTLQISYLNLSNNVLTEMALVSQLVQLNTLDLNHNKITSLSPSFLMDLRDLNMFSASHNELKLLPIKLFKGCDNLKTIDLSYNVINLLDEATFSNANRVSFVSLSHNEISDINTIFSGLKDLETLDLSDNQITKVLRGQFPPLIKHINLARNKIMFISAYTFKTLSRIQTVDLSDNKLTSLNRMDVEIAFNLGYLPMFNIRYNPFVCDCKLGWLKDWSMGKLKDMLTLPSFGLNYGFSCSNPFYNYQPILQTLPRSEFLCPYRNHCEESCMCCDYVCYCKYICPSACQCYIGGDYWHVHQVQCNAANLTSVPAGLPEGATDLRLDGNNIQILHKHEFLALKRVENFYLNNSQIETIENNTFRGLKSVKRLYLHDNYLTIIYSVTLQGLDSLEELYLHNNDLFSLDVHAFLSPPALSLVNIQGNALTTISISDLLNFINRTSSSGVKTKLYLGGNHWSCDLEFACKFLAFVQKNSEFILDISSIECIAAGITDKPLYVQPGSSLLIDLHPELCSYNQTTYENMTRQDIEALSSSTEIYVLIAVCIIIVFGITLLIVAYANRHLLQVLCFTKFGFRMFKMAKPCDDNERPYDAFISYSNKDEDFVIRQLAPRLENGDKKFKLCVHYRDFPVGACIAETIVRSVEASQRTILVISDNFLDSEWCRFEFQTAHQQVLNERRNRVILILLHDLDSDKLDRTLKVYMRTRTYLKYDDPWFWEKLMFAMPDIRQRKGDQNAGNVDYLARNNQDLGNSQTTCNRNCCESIHNDMYEIPVLDSPSGHYQLANSISCSTHTNSAYHNSDLSDSLSGYNNGSVTGSCCHYEEVGPASSSTPSTPQKQVGTPPPVPSFPKEGLVPREKLMSLKV